MNEKSNIPHGDYCYTWEETPSAANNFLGKINKCPYWQVKNINGVDLPWCAYLEAGSLPNSLEQWRGWEDYAAAIQTLQDYFGDKYEEKTRLFLLWDMVKECQQHLP